MLLNYTLLNVHTISYANEDEPTGVSNLILIPGNNEVSDEVFEAASKHPAMAQMLDDGTIEVQAVDSPVELTETKAVAMVNKTVEQGLLEKWLAAEKRAKVKAAINAQLDKIDPVKAKAKDDADKLAQDAK